MAITKPSRSMLSTGISDSSDATFLTADSSENATFAGNLTVSGNLTVTGTTTQVDTVTMNAQNAVLFEGATADAHETTLTTVDPTGDRTISLPNVSGTLPVLAVASVTAITSTPEELNLLDGVSGLVQADLTKLAAIDSTAAEINLLDALDRGSILYGNASGATAVLGQGSANQVLTSDGTDIAWADAGGVSAIDGLSDATTSETNSIMLGTATHGTINGAAQNTSVGIGAMDAITSAEYTVAIGYNAATALTSGSYNTAVGGNALITATDGHSNTAIGMSALKFTTSGDYNTALGRTALQANTTANNNTAIGWASLLVNETGFENTCVGSETLKANTGSNNTAVGTECMKNNVGGTQNAAFGKAALITNTSGNYNTAIGPYTIKTNSSGHNNVALGWSALENATGSNNTALGYNALNDCTGAEGNVAIGPQAMAANSNNAAHNNIAIGRDAMKAQTVATDNIAIGAYAMDGCDSASTSQTVAIGSYAGSGALAGYGNVFVGYQTGLIATSALHNVAIGRDALSGLTTGDDNVCIGAYAGKDTNAVEGGVYNVFIGSKTRGTHPSHSSAIAIGYNIDAAPGQVAIGTSALGKVYNEFNTDNAWSQGSDERLKQHIKDSTLGLEFINDLRPVTYNWKPSNELPEEWPLYHEENQRDVETIMTGLIAQEVKTAINKSGVARFGGWDVDNDGMQQIKKELFIFPLINAVKELTAKLGSKDDTIAALEKRIETIEQRLI
ncbi:hypothetical protein [uncultured Mediterranean phage]|nr:hypothetical protein [uncultured Mediterranean phage]